ncbi:MAG: TonB-dependent receptor [Bacteroidales bacterium]|nr:TonB-dependent receptor [Bacteroidales bacterium]
MRHLNFLSFVFALTISAGLYAQTNVKGTVLDSLSRQPEVGAVVQFIRNGEDRPAAYSVTDSLGKFERTVPGSGEYVLLLQNMGRKAVRMVFKTEGQAELDLGVILLQDDAQSINSATVQAMKTLVKLDVGKLTYKVEEDPDSKTGTVLDMLRKVPMVTVDGQDNITVNGSSNFKVYVDGKPNQMLSSNPSQVLKVMPASAVKDIEVITNPGAKYDAEGTGGVLNLVTGSAAGASSAVQDGVYGSVNLGYTNRGENGSLYLSAKKGKLTVGMNSSVGVQHQNGVTYEAYQKNLDLGTNLSTDMRQDQKSPFVFADFSASYELSPKDLISGTFGMTGFFIKAEGASTMTMEGPLSYSYMSDQKTNYATRSVNGSLDYQHSSTDVPGRVFTLSYRYSGTPLNTELTNRFTSETMPFADRMSKSDDNSLENTFQADYTTPLGNGHSLSSGLKYIARHNTADDKLFYAESSGWNQSKEGSMIYDHYNDIGAVYSEYTGVFGKVVLITGLRYEYTWQRVDYGEGYGHDFKATFGDIVPNASVQLNISPTKNVGVTYNRRIQRPGITYLNPYVDRSSPTNITYGNSDLTSARTDIVSFVYNHYDPKWIVSLTGRYSHTGGGISSYSFHDEDGIFNTTYGNIVREDNTGMTAFINWTAGPKTRIYTNTTVGYGIFSSKEMDQTNHGWNWNVVAGLQQTLPSDYLLSANLVGGGRTWTLQGWTGGYTLGVLGISKGFLNDKIRAQVQFVSNLDKGPMDIKSFAHGRDYETGYVVSVPVRQVGIGLTWNFGNQGFQVKKTRKTITNDDVINNTNGQSIGTGVGTTTGAGQKAM